MKGTFEGEHTKEGELSELVLKRGAYLKREPIREGYFLRGELIREGSKKDRKRWRGRVMTYLPRTTVQCNFFFSRSILSGTDFVVVLHIFNPSANDTYLL